MNRQAPVDSDLEIASTHPRLQQQQQSDVFKNTDMEVCDNDNGDSDNVNGPLFCIVMAQPPTTRNSDAGSPDSNQSVNKLRTIVSYNMHGYNQGSSTVRDLSLSIEPDIFLLQERWLTPANLYKLEENFPQYLCIGTSAMRSSVESGVLYGRPFGGVCILVSKKFLHCTEIICCSDRFIVVGVNRPLIINVYLPCAGTTDRMCH